MDRTPAGKDLAENGLLHATLPSLLAQTAPASSWDPHEEGASPDMVGMSQESGWAQGEESVLSDQPLPVALTIGAREDEINRNIDNQNGKGQAGPNPTTKPMQPQFMKGSLLSRVGAKGGVAPPLPNLVKGAQRDAQSLENG